MGLIQQRCMECRTPGGLGDVDLLGKHDQEHFYSCRRDDAVGHVRRHARPGSVFDRILIGPDGQLAFSLQNLDDGRHGGCVFG